MGDCKWIQSKMDEYIDGALAENEQQLVELHLADCVECRSEFEDYRLIGMQLQSWAVEEIEPPAEFHAQLMTKISHVQPAVQPKKNNIYSFNRWKKWVPSVAAAAIIFCFIPTIFQDSAETNPNSTQLAQEQQSQSMVEKQPVASNKQVPMTGEVITDIPKDVPQEETTPETMVLPEDGDAVEAKPESERIIAEVQPAKLEEEVTPSDVKIAVLESNNDDIVSAEQPTVMSVPRHNQGDGAVESPSPIEQLKKKITFLEQEQEKEFSSERESNILKLQNQLKELEQKESKEKATEEKTE